MIGRKVPGKTAYRKNVTVLLRKKVTTGAGQAETTVRGVKFHFCDCSEKVVINQLFNIPSKQSEIRTLIATNVFTHIVGHTNTDNATVR